MSFSSDAIEACSREGIPIHFVDALGRPYAALYSAGLTGTVLTRREQLLAYADRRGLRLALAFARGKIRNQAGFLRYMAKYRQESAPQLHALLRDGADRLEEFLDGLKAIKAERVDEVRGEILALEGRAAQIYWDTLRAVVPAKYNWPGRKTRKPGDAINNALNYGYGILYNAVQRSLVLAGLDPYGGFIHTDRPGKPSLVFDLIEEFRQVVVDRTVFGLANKGVALHLNDKNLLDEKTRRTIADKVTARLEAAERYERKRQPLRTILQSQARHIATFVRGDRARYEPFIARW
ncbi:MAG: CRISPR-associated endonuclease Cas1 [Caldilineae bacterium]|nr:MAG: CRISPR-associated endonuclease Cas1 [Caldilineae bacterium]